MLRTLGGPGELLDAIRAHAPEREAELNMMIGIASSGRPGMVAAALEGESLFAAVVREAPRGIVLASADGDAAEALAAALADAGMLLDAPGVLGTAPAVGRFANTFAASTGQRAERAMAQRILKLAEVTPPAPAPEGYLRLATHEDAECVAPWFGEFARETGSSVGEQERLAHAAARIESGDLHLWETDRPVSMAALARRTWTGVAVNAVYTPPELRDRGDASACVAALRQRALDAGRSVCVLYTDASNRTSNRIYERIGYRRDCESEEWRFH
jgi:predicted GNAT family acetyltransferase